MHPRNSIYHILWDNVGRCRRRRRERERGVCDYLGGCGLNGEKGKRGVLFSFISIWTIDGLIYSSIHSSLHGKFIFFYTR